MPEDHAATRSVTRGVRPNPDHWAVTVWRNGDAVVTIESNCLSGRDLLPGDEDAILTAARNLLGFVGVSA